MGIRDSRGEDQARIAMMARRIGPRASVSDDVAALIARARKAQAAIDDYDQARVDELVTAAGWAIVEPARNRALAERAVRDTGLGNVDDKIAKNRRKTMGLLRDLAGRAVRRHHRRGSASAAWSRSRGRSAWSPRSRRRRIPGATPANNIINALKGRNAIVLAPSPKGASTLALLLDFVHAELDRVGAPRDLVLALPSPVIARAHARADAAGRPGRRDRLAEQRARGLRERHARARGGRGQRRGDRRRDRRHRRRRAQDRDVEDVRQRDELLVREQRHRRRRRSRQRLLDALARAGGVLLDARRSAALEQAMFADGKLRPEFVAQSAGDDRAAAPASTARGTRGS